MNVTDFFHSRRAGFDAVFFDIDGEHVFAVFVHFDIVVGDRAEIGVEARYVTTARELGIRHKSCKTAQNRVVYGIFDWVTVELRNAYRIHQR